MAVWGTPLSNITQQKTAKIVYFLKENIQNWQYLPIRSGFYDSITQVVGTPLCNEVVVVDQQGLDRSPTIGAIVCGIPQVQSRNQFSLVLYEKFSSNVSLWDTNDRRTFNREIECFQIAVYSAPDLNLCVGVRTVYNDIINR